ncbi:MAG: hypothetical protein U1E78_08385 [Gammaproteobacteria bacterium]
MDLINETDLYYVCGGQINFEEAINLTLLTTASIVSAIAFGTMGRFIGSTISYATSDERYIFGGMVVGLAIDCLIPFAVVYALL